MNLFNLFALDFKILGGDDLGFWLTNISGRLFPILVVLVFDVTRRKKFRLLNIFGRCLFFGRRLCRVNGCALYASFWC